MTFAHAAWVASRITGRPTCYTFLYCIKPPLTRRSPGRGTGQLQEEESRLPALGLRPKPRGLRLREVRDLEKVSGRSILIFPLPSARTSPAGRLLRRKPGCFRLGAHQRGWRR